MTPYARLIASMANQRGLDPRAVLAIAYNESGIRRGAVGDNGTSFGPFQLHQGGALPRGQGLAWAGSRAGIAYALDHMASVARGLKGQAAVAAISRRFERPANPGAEIATAMRWYGGNPGAAAGLGDPSMHVAARGGMAGLGPGGGGGGRQALIQTLLRANQQYATTGHFDPTAVQTQMIQSLRSAGGQAGKDASAFSPSMPASGAAGKAIQAARSVIGTPYLWGGESKKGFDCSGLIQWAFQQAGLQVPRTTYDQIKHGAQVHWGQFKPGDLIFSDFEGTGKPTHVVMYVGNGRVIAAPHTGTTVQIENVNAFRNNFIGARRYF